MARRIDDHSFWGGGMSKGSVLSDGVKKKMEQDVEGAGAEGDYYDTSEKIAGEQRKSVSKVKSNGLQPGYRH